MLIAQNETRESGSFCGDQLCSLRAAYLFVQNQPDVDRVIMSVSPANEMSHLWTRFIADPRGDGGVPPVELVYDDFNPGDWTARWAAWDKWRVERSIDGRPFQHFRELYLRIHGARRQTILCGHERGLGRRNIFAYWVYGQENMPETCQGDDVYDVEIDHPPLTRERDVYVSVHCKTQGNATFTFHWWQRVCDLLVEAGVSVTVGYNDQAGPFNDAHLRASPLYRRHWGDHVAWRDEVCRHRLVACGNTGTGWLAAACGVPLLSVEPHGSVMADHRYRECGLRNLVEVVDGYKLDELDNDMARAAEYVARRITEYVRRKVVLTTGCYDVLHAGHVRHLERARALGTKLVVALNSDASVASLKGPARPVNPVGQRRAVLEALRCVDEVRVFDGPDALDLIRELRPDVLACGYGYTEDTVVGRALVESWGGRAVVTCRADASDEPPLSTTRVVARLVSARDVAEIVRQGAAYSVNPPDKLKLMAVEFLRVAGVAGDVADLGAYRGGTSLILRRLAPEKHLHLFDNWGEGTPYDDPLCHHRKGEWAVNLEDCRALVGRDERTHYWQGTFPLIDWALWPTVINDLRLCFVYCDMDTYQATHDAVEFFWPRLVTGGMLFFDDWQWEPCAGVEKAIREAFTEDQWRAVPALHACIVEKR
jgi:rfaE bifunctional protein nucleotidyltransferase chain/domain